MSFNWTTFKPSWQTVLAIFLGISLGLAFPTNDIDSLAWIVPGIVVLMILHYLPSDSSPFRFGWIFGFSFWLFTLRWLLYMPFPSGAILGWLSLSAYLAFYLGVWSWGIKKIGKTFSIFSLSLFAGASWVTLEWIRGWLFSGFAWNYLGVSQHALGVITPLVSITGLYGLSLLMVAFSTSWIINIYQFIFHLKHHSALSEPTQNQTPFYILHSQFFKEGLIWLVILIGVSVYGIYRTNKQSHSNDSSTYHIAMIQPSIPQSLLWDPKENAQRFEELIRASKELIGTNSVDLLVWPEAAVPGYVRYETNIANPIIQLSKKIKTPILFCCDDAEPNIQDPQKTDYYNCAFLINEYGELCARYIKRHLVIFGEYVPLSKWLPFLKYLTPIGGNYTEGATIETFPWPNSEKQIAPLICFEDAFPEEARQHAKGNVCAFAFLINAGWFGESSAQWQHLANAQFRCIENGIPAIRSCNNGITCWIDSLGNIQQTFFDEKNSVYGKGGVILSISLGDRKDTIYHRYGDWFVWVCLLWVARCAGVFYLKTRKNRYEKNHKTKVGVAYQVQQTLQKK